ncbi:MAG: amidohydrolase family protein [Leptolyngbya sp.]|nr:amidohydrolase family protein [Candidatus Melainabacteria bacterium]
MTSDILIKGGRVINPTEAGSSSNGKTQGSLANNQVLDVRIQDGKITELASELKPRDGEAVIDAQGLWVMPGFVDMHTHLRDLGQADREDIYSGTGAAAAGGYTTVVAMANTDPPTDCAEILDRIIKRIQERALIEVLPVASVTKGLKGVELTNMVEMADMGAIAFSDDGMPISNLGVLKRALEYARLHGKPIISHP